MPRAGRPHVLALFCLAATVSAQPLSRVAATSLRFPAAAPPTTYSTARAFPSLSFSQPVALVSPPGDASRLFVVEKTGRIYLVPDVTATNPTRTLFLDLSGRVAVSNDFNDERGLLALAFHPEYATNGQFFVWYTTNASTAAGTGLHDRLSRFRVSTVDPTTAEPGSEEPLITQRDEANNHNGGQLLFGPDGYLYLSLGDEGGANDQYQNGQRIDRDFFAGILRLDVDRRPGSLPPNAHAAVHAGTYAVPPDNPFAGATSFNGNPVSPGAVRTEFWAVGLRNPWRMSFDSASGRLWCADVGQNAREEINVIVRGGNYGWPYREGGIAGPRPNPPDAAVFIAPIWDYARSEGQSVTGGFVYRGSRLSGLTGHYLFADFVTGRFWSLQPDGTRSVSADRVRLLATDGGISSFGIDPSNGDVLVADLTEGAIKRLVATTRDDTVGFPATLSAAGIFSNLASLTPAAGVVGYRPNVTGWSDHASVRHWFGLPDSGSRIGFSSEGPWSFPPGAVWVQHFDLPFERGNPASERRIETRVLVKTADAAYGLSYRWNEAQTDALLVPEDGADTTFAILENGQSRPQAWRFPNRAECAACHTRVGGHAIGFNTRQLNREYTFPGGQANILQALTVAGYLDPAPPNDAAGLPALAPTSDSSIAVELRARAYLDANCAHCHQPGGPAPATWDARATTPLSLSGMVNGAVVDTGGDPASRILVPGNRVHSNVHLRMTLRGPRQMPPFATNERDIAGLALLEQWIAQLATPAAPSRLLNLAARAETGAAAQILTAGFVIGPGEGKRVLLRAAGATLANPPFNVPGALANPRLTLFGPDSSTRVAAANDDWHLASNGAEVRSIARQLGAFAFPENSVDAALLATLSPGAYTAQVASATTASGVALIEIYDADETPPSPSSRFLNTSVRAHVGTGANILIPGLVVGPGAAKNVLIRAVGPGLVAFGVDDPLAKPALALFSGSERRLTNTGWTTASNAAEIRAAARQVGAFALAEDGADSALLVSLSPGAYTVQVAGENERTGVVLVEVYEVP